MNFHMLCSASLAYFAALFMALHMMISERMYLLSSVLVFTILTLRLLVLEKKTKPTLSSSRRV